MDINARTELYCIFGNPVAHSLSPIMHNTAFRNFNINSVYMAFKPESLAGAAAAMRSLNIKGASITIPFKTDIISLIDKVHPLALQIGAVNTLVNKDGLIEGYNTDGIGAVLALEHSGISLENSRVMIIGNGGSARAIAFTILGKKAEVIICGRNLSRVSELSKSLKDTGFIAETVIIDNITNDIMKRVDIIINTTPIGMSPQTSLSPLNADFLSDHHTVFDIIYSPDTTELLKHAIRKGCKTVKGIDMLIHQGIAQFEIWTGFKPPYELILDALKPYLDVDNE